MLQKFNYFNLFKKNNTFINTSKINGDVLVWKTCVSLGLGFTNAKKKTFMAKRMANKYSLKRLRLKLNKFHIVFLHFVGKLRWFRLVFKGMVLKNILIGLVFFKIKLSFNGCRLKKKRRKNRGYLAQR